MNASATLVFSQGHHPANHRSAVPARAYESGSGHGHDAAPAGHPHPPRPPPAPLPSLPAHARAVHHRHPPAPLQGRLRRRSASSASAPRPLTRAQPGARIRRLSGHGHTPACPEPPRQISPKITQTTETPAHHLQKLDEPLHMSAQWLGRLMVSRAWRRSPGRVGGGDLEGSAARTLRRGQAFADLRAGARH
jgi:hypothetical protein